ncbi:MscS Mechanosensitive ion channel [Oceanithermus profundus DSM 14977]|uniref:MscS Mechanosensitive ion channel n=1 Tax=Oceanithermus profundus (strain DSM 14977 / NBRC 100410 / VKM B-2274 / 506) TaxID=670487 RepID=E4U9E8_OCEP5|nr:mechanosensitive ion channel family protein [Oceanithermus profundus]ADR37044.1 MscS Mechanosensitive ion channel [Oceanithermus profundus DSM 14977]
MNKIWSHMRDALERVSGAGPETAGWSERGYQAAAWVGLVVLAWAFAWLGKAVTLRAARRLEPRVRRRLAGGWDLVFWSAALVFAVAVFGLGDPQEVARAAAKLLFVYLVWVALEAFVEGRLVRRGFDPNLVLLLRYVTLTLLVVWGAYMVAGAQIAPVIGALGVLGLAVGLAAQDTFSNFIAGIILLMDRPFKIGDWVQIGGEYGQVEGLTLRTTRLRTPDNESVAIPNAVVAGGEIKNLSAGGPLRLRIPVGVAYRHDPREVRKVLEAVVAAHPKLLSDPAPAVLVTGLGDNSVDFTLVVWIPEHEIPGYPVVAAELTEAAKIALDEAGIEIPFPQRTVWFPEPLRVIQETPSGG